MPRPFPHVKLSRWFLFFACAFSLTVVRAVEPTESMGDAWRLDAATYLGDAGDDNASAMALGSDGALYVVMNSTVVPNEDVRDWRAENTKKNVGYDIVLRKYHAGGSELEWTLLLGGAGSDVAQGLVLDRDDNVYLCGSSDSSSLSRDTQLRVDKNERAAFVLKIDANGERVVWNRWLGSGGESSARAIALDNAGGVWLGGDTAAQNFVTTSRVGAGGGVDGWIAQLDSAGQWQRAVRIGGTSDDFVRALSFDEQGTLWLCGDTSSRDFPTSENAKTRFAGGSDAWLARLAPDLSTLESTSFWGGEGSDYARALATRDGRVVIAGFSSSARDDNLRAERVGTLGRWDAFIAQADSAGDAWDWSQIWGGRDNDFAAALALDWRGAILVAGHKDSSDFPSNGPNWNTQTLGARGGIDSWLLRLEPVEASDEGDDHKIVTNSGQVKPSDLLILGGSGDDWLRGLVLGRNGVVLTGQTSSNDFPLSHSVQPASGGATDAFAMWLRGQESTLTAFAPDSEFPNDPVPATDYPNDPTPSAYPSDRYSGDTYSANAYPRDDYPSDYTPDPYPNSYPYPNPYPYPAPYPNPYPYPAPYPYPRPRPGDYGGDRPELKLRIDPQTVSERAGRRAALGEVWRNTRRNETLVLTLESNRPDRVRVPNRLVIRRGESSATFWIDVLDNDRADGDVKVYITVRRGTSYYNFNSDAESLRVLDDEGGRGNEGAPSPFYQRLNLRIEPQSLDRTGAGAARGRVTRGGDLSRSLRVNLTSSAPTVVRVPSQLLIEARQDSADFSVDVAPEARNSNQRIQIKASADQALDAAFTITLNGTNRPDPNRPPVPNRNFRLEVTITPDEVRPGITQARGRVRRNGTLDAPLIVALSSSDTNLVRVPPQVTIPAGRDGVDFPVVLNPAVRTGASTAVVEATALGQRDATSVRFQRVDSPNTPTSPFDPVRPVPPRPTIDPRSIPAPMIPPNPQRRPNYPPDPDPNPAPVQPTAPRPEPEQTKPRLFPFPPRREPEQRDTRPDATQRKEAEDAENNRIERLKAALEASERRAAQKAAQEAAERAAVQNAGAQDAARQKAAQDAAAEREAAQRKTAQDAAQKEAAERRAAYDAAQREAAQRVNEQRQAAADAARREAAKRAEEQREATRRVNEQRQAAADAARREAAQRAEEQRRAAAAEAARREAAQRADEQRRAAADAARRAAEKARDDARREAEKARDDEQKKAAGRR